MGKQPRGSVKNPCKTCTTEVLRQQMKEGSVGDTGAEERWTEAWYNRQEYYAAKRAIKKVIQKPNKVRIV